MVFRASAGVACRQASAFTPVLSKVTEGVAHPFVLNMSAVCESMHECVCALSTRVCLHAEVLRAAVGWTEMKL